MRLRDPEKKLSGRSPDSINATENHNWISYDFELITPMYGGGVKKSTPDKEMPVRASSIKGQLRYWWRFLKQNKTNPPVSGKELFDEERKIWGGAAENGSDFSSKIRLKVENIHGIRCQEYNGNEAGYALFPARGLSEAERPDDLIREGMTFTLKVYLTEESIKNDIEETLSWWATFGGLGGRTRRGLGSVYSANINTVSEQEAKDAGCELVIIEQTRGTTAIEAWKKAIDRLCKFRQGPGVGRRKGYGRSYWPEADSIREITGCFAPTHTPDHRARISFPRAAFGLPIIFKFRDDTRNDPQQTELALEDGERMASPIILTPYPLTNLNGDSTSYKPAALFMPTKHINNITLSLKYSSNRELLPRNSHKKYLNSKGWENWSSDWWDNSKSSEVEPIKTNDGKDALTAFRNFFAKGGR